MILALDPGTTQTGYIFYDGRVSRGIQDGSFECGILPNAEMLGLVKAWNGPLACEMIASYGMAVGREVFETCVWIGRFIQAHHSPDKVQLIYRQQVKLHLCKSTKAKDANVRQAIIDLFEPSGCGTVPQVGTKSNPGPLYGVSSHVWPALGVAITALSEKQ